MLAELPAGVPAQHSASHYEASAVGFTAEGHLRVSTDDGKEVALMNEEVTIRPA